MHREQVCQSPWIQCDDTTLDVQDPSRAPEIRTGHLWVYRGELGDVVYDFTWSRNRDGPLKMLGHYQVICRWTRRPPREWSESGAMTEERTLTALADLSGHWIDHIQA